MKKGLLFLAALSLSGAAFAQRSSKALISVTPTVPAAETGLAIGSDIPFAHALLVNTDASKGPVSLQSVQTRQGLLVMFSCNTCPFVVKSQARTAEMMKMAKDLGVGAAIINSNLANRAADDSYEAMKEYAAKMEYTVPYLMDEGTSLADAFGATRTPEVFLFDGQGHLVYKGAMEDNPATPSESTKLYLKAAMQNMTAGKAVDPDKTKSIGCSIKRKS